MKAEKNDKYWFSFPVNNKAAANNSNNSNNSNNNDRINNKKISFTLNRDHEAESNEEVKRMSTPTST